MTQYGIDATKKYRRMNGHVFTGQQVLNLLEISPGPIKVVILLEIQETDLPATDPKSRYGLDTVHPTPLPIFGNRNEQTRSD